MESSRRIQHLGRLQRSHEFSERSQGAEHVLAESSLVQKSKSFAKWESMVERGLEWFILSHPQTYLRRLRRGTPQKYRWEVWKLTLRWKLTQKAAEQKKQTGAQLKDNPYPSMANRKSNSDKKLSPLSDIRLREYLDLAASESLFSSLIKIDIPRTFPDLEVFKSNAQEQLARILNAYANYNRAVGYCQGMNFVVGLLLLVSDFREFETFQFLTGLMTCYGIEGLFREHFPLLGQYVETFDTVMKELTPALRDHFLAEGVFPAVYLHQWFLTLFVRGLPLCTVVVIWDYLLADGLPSLIVLTISLLKVLQRFLLCLDFENIVKFLKSLKLSGDCDESRIGRMLVRQAETVQVPEYLLAPLRDIDLEMLSRKCIEMAIAPNDAAVSSLKDHAVPTVYAAAGSLDQLVVDDEDLTQGPAGRRRSVMRKPNPLLRYLLVQNQAQMEDGALNGSEVQDVPPAEEHNTVEPQNPNVGQTDSPSPRTFDDGDLFPSAVGSNRPPVTLSPGSVRPRFTSCEAFSTQKAPEDAPGRRPSVSALSCNDMRLPNRKRLACHTRSRTGWSPLYTSAFWNFAYSQQYSLMGEPKRRNSATQIKGVEVPVKPKVDCVVEPSGHREPEVHKQEAPELKVKETGSHHSGDQEENGGKSNCGIFKARELQLRTLRLRKAGSGEPEAVKAGTQTIEDGSAGVPDIQRKTMEDQASEGLNTEEANVKEYTHEGDSNFKATIKNDHHAEVPSTEQRNKEPPDTQDLRTGTPNTEVLSAESQNTELWKRKSCGTKETGDTEILQANESQGLGASASVRSDTSGCMAKRLDGDAGSRSATET